jgi:hypothetical protein
MKKGKELKMIVQMMKMVLVISFLMMQMTAIANETISYRL